VRHVNGTSFLDLWMGCGSPRGTGGIDDEADAKFNASSTPGDPSLCGGAPTDGVESGPLGAWFGQDESYGDADAGLIHPMTFQVCSTSAVAFSTYLCGPPGGGDYGLLVNVLVDWNQDGDWNDTFICPESGQCVHEWAVKNEFGFASGECGVFVTAPFRTGPFPGRAWMRVSVMIDLAPDDFPWNGSTGTANGRFNGGETEDYLVTIQPSTVDVAGGPRPHEAWLGASRPNPAGHETTIPFALARAGEVSLAVFDPSGRRLRDLGEGPLPAGTHQRRWDFRDDRGRRVPTGVYLIRLEVEGRVLTQRVTHID